MENEYIDKMVQMYQNTVGAMNHQIIMLALENEQKSLEIEKLRKEIATLKGEE